MGVKALPYIAWQTIWGLPQTAAGGATFLAFARDRHFLHHGAVVTVWKYRTALSLGPFIFLGSCGNGIDDRLLVHEYGHTIQSLILGPLYLPVIGLPSFMWFRMPRFANRRHAQGLSYYSFYTERWANHLGELVLKRPSMGQAIID